MLTRRAQLAPAPGVPPEQQPDEVFPVSQSSGTIKWACAQFAAAFDGGGAGNWSRIATEAANQTVWMKYANPAG